MWLGVFNKLYICVTELRSAWRCLCPCEHIPSRNIPFMSRRDGRNVPTHVIMWPSQLSMQHLLGTKYTRPRGTLWAENGADVILSWCANKSVSLHLNKETHCLPVWMSLCVSRVVRSLNVFPHSSHMKSFIPAGKGTGEHTSSDDRCEEECGNVGQSMSVVVVVWMSRRGVQTQLTRVPLVMFQHVDLLGKLAVTFLALVLFDALVKLHVVSEGVLGLHAWTNTSVRFHWNDAYVVTTAPRGYSGDTLLKRALSAAWMRNKFHPPACAGVVGGGTPTSCWFVATLSV